MSDPRIIPDPETFRAWLRASLAATKTSPTALARECGLGTNGVTQFLASGARDLRLGTAQKIERDLRRRAALAGIKLPAMTDSASVAA